MGGGDDRLQREIHQIWTEVSEGRRSREPTVDGEPMREAIRVEDGVRESRNDHATQVPGGTEDTLRASLYSQTPIADVD